MPQDNVSQESSRLDKDCSLPVWYEYLGDCSICTCIHLYFASRLTNLSFNVALSWLYNSKFKISMFQI